MDGFYAVAGMVLLAGGVLIGTGFGFTDYSETKVVGTPTYMIDGYMINFKEPSAYGESYKSVKESSYGYTTMDKYIVIKSHRSLNDVDEACVHEVAHNENPDRRHSENSSSPWFDRQERLTSHEVCDELKRRLLEDSDKYLRSP